MIVPAWNSKNPTDIIKAIRQLADGRSNVAGQATLRANETTTTVTNAAIPAGCFPVISPASSTAAAEWAAGSIYVSSVANGSFVITHANDASTTRKVNWYAVGG